MTSTESDEDPRRVPEPADPMLLTASSAEGDPLAMADGLVEELARIGLTADQILELFEAPEFQATHRLTLVLGRDAVRARIERTLARTGVMRTTDRTAPEAPPLVQIGRR